MVDALLDAMLQGERLAGAEGHDHYFAGFQDGLDAHCQGHLGHLVQVVFEETAVGKDGAISQSLDAGPGGQAGAWLVEGNVAILAHAGQEEVNATSGLDLCLILDTLGLKIRGIAVEDVNVARVDVDVGEKVPPHERVVALGMVPRNAYVLVLHRDSAVEAEIVRWEQGSLPC